MKRNKLRHLEINGGQVLEEGMIRLLLPPVARGYADTQVDDYGLYTGSGAGRWRRSPSHASDPNSRSSSGRPETTQSRVKT
jgi:hypothetical protein